MMSNASPRCQDGDKRLQCKVMDCPADSSPSTTTVSGKVYDPAGRVPLYNAVVYIVEDPDNTLKPLGQRVKCESCSEHFPKTAMAVALTGSDGSFRLTDVPAGDNIPLVVQLGKWRRVVKIPHVAPCTDNPQPIELTRLPRNSTEGDLPKIAVTTGGSDALECLLKKIGVDEAEFTPDGGEGRVNLFSGYRAAKTINVAGASQPLSTAEELWASSDRMLDYDMILMGCEGEGSIWKEEPTVTMPPPLPRPVAMQLEVRKYADLGGRIFGSHWHHRWINSDDTTPDNPYPPSGPALASFSQSSQGFKDEMKESLLVDVDATFPKGVAFRDWLVNVKASTVPGQLSVKDAEHSVNSINPGFARQWIYGTDPLGIPDTTRVPEMVQYFSFTAPVGAANECGRMVFSDLHVSLGGMKPDTPFPERCKLGELSPQEKALEFMIFDLSSCIQKEDDEIKPPIVK